MNEERDKLNKELDKDGIIIKEDEKFSMNYAMAIGVGLPLGLLVGLLIFDNVGLGLALSLCFAPLVVMLMGKYQESKKTETKEENPPLQ